MMYRTCTVQVNLDFASEADMVQKFRVVAGAAAGGDGALRQLALLRGQGERLAVVARAHLAGHRSRTAPACCPSSSRTAWASSATSTTRSTCRCTSSTATAATSTRWASRFRDFLDGRLPALPGEKPTLSDWADHLTTIFPEVRLKKFMEMRGRRRRPVAADLRPAGVLGGAALRRGLARRRLGPLPRLDGGGARRAAPRRGQARAARRDPRAAAARGRRRGARHLRGGAQGAGAAGGRRDDRRRDALPERAEGDRRLRA